MPCAPRTRRESCRSSIGSPPARPRRGRSRPARRWGSRPAGSSPRARMPSIQHELVVEKDNSIEVAVAVARGANVREPGRDVSAGAVVAAAGHSARPGADRRARGRRGRRGRLRPPPAGGGADHGDGASRARLRARPRRGLRGERSDARRPARNSRRRGDAPRLGRRRRGRAPAGAGAGLEYDVLVTSGGVSVGPHDLVRRIEAELGVEEVFWRVAVRPGKPVSFGVRGADARLRAAREPGLDAGRLRALRAAGGARAAGSRRSRPEVLGRPPRRDRLEEPGARRPDARPHRGDRRRDRALSRSRARSRT